MTYTFKRLAEVEEIQEAPETANAFVEVDGKVKRAPYRAGGGGAKIDDLRFDLDTENVVEGSNPYVKFTNMDQIKKVWDNDMNIVILYRSSTCCGVTTGYKEYRRCNTTAKLMVILLLFRHNLRWVFLEQQKVVISKAKGLLQ